MNLVLNQKGYIMTNTEFFNSVVIIICVITIIFKILNIKQNEN